MRSDIMLAMLAMLVIITASIFSATLIFAIRSDSIQNSLNSIENSLVVIAEK